MYRNVQILRSGTICTGRLSLLSLHWQDIFLPFVECCSCWKMAPRAIYAVWCRPGHILRSVPPYDIRFYTYTYNRIIQEHSEKQQQVPYILYICNPEPFGTCNKLILTTVCWGTRHGAQTPYRGSTKQWTTLYIEQIPTAPRKNPKGPDNSDTENQYFVLIRYCKLWT